MGVGPVLTQHAATVDVARGVNTGHRRTSRPQWTLMRHWLDEVLTMWEEPGDLARARAPLAAHIRAGTEDDVVWWLGATKGIVLMAVARPEAVAVTLDSGAIGWLPPDELHETRDPGAWAACPGPRPTVMGWKERDFYLGAHREQLFDRAGNAGTMTWVDALSSAAGCRTTTAS